MYKYVNMFVERGQKAKELPMCYFENTENVEWVKDNLTELQFRMVMWNIICNGLNADETIEKVRKEIYRLKNICQENQYNQLNNNI